MDVPHRLDGLMLELEQLTPDRISALAARFSAAEASPAESGRRAVARHLAMTPDTPGVISVLAGQLALSDVMMSWEAVYALEEETSYAARAAVLDMGLVLCVDTLPDAGAEALAEPWLAAMHPEHLTPWRGRRDAAPAPRLDAARELRFHHMGSDDDQAPNDDSSS